jgi:hypothetical protein
MNVAQLLFVFLFVFCCSTFIASQRLVFFYTGTLLISLPVPVEHRPPSSLTTLPHVRSSHACHGVVLELKCAADEILVFETARYGRGVDPTLASLCQVHFAAACDVDVRFSLNRACGGRRQCSLSVDSVTFGNPCGYGEFLTITYRCIEGKSGR